MAELRTVDPSSLTPNPENPRRTAAPQAMDDQLVASIKAIGLIQPPRVKDADGSLVIITGNRRVKAAIAAGLLVIDVLVCDADETADAMRSVSENLIRASMTSVDIWRATEALEAQGWTEQGIADALALPVRTIKRLKLLAHLHPAMLDVMATGNMPNEEWLRTIAAASRDEQAQIWKKYKPKKGHDVAWHEVARALSKRRMPFSAAKFDDALAESYGVVWDDDLFAPAGEDGRTTTNVEGFFGAQQEWLQTNLPQGNTLLPTNEYGTAQLPKKAQVVHGKPGKLDTVGHYLDPRSGEVRTVAYRLPEPKKPAKAAKTADPAETPDAGSRPAGTRPDLTHKGNAMIGDLRTDALHQALHEAEIDDGTLLALLVLAFAGQNVSVQSGADEPRLHRQTACLDLMEGGVLTRDQHTVRTAARTMLRIALSCRDNATDSGIVARIAGDAIGAVRHLPNMATEEFLACLSKTALEKAATTEGVRVGARGKDTRANLVERFKSGTYVYPGAHFPPTPQEVTAAVRTAERLRNIVAGRWTEPDDDTDGGSAGADEDGDPNDDAEPGDWTDNPPGHLPAAAE